MALTLADLRYRVGATDTAFRQTMQNVQSRLQQVHETVRQGATAWRDWSLAVAAAGTAVAFALRRVTDETAKTATQVDKFSKQTGIATSALQALGYAASQEHASLETLGQGLVRLTRRTAEAASGNQAYLASYQRLGIEIRNADGSIRGTEELLLDIAEAFEGISDEGERARIAFNLLGDSGYALLPFLSLGRREIERLMQEAHDLGIVISRENIARFVQYDAIMGRFRATVTGLRNEVAVAVIPIFNVLAERGTEGVQAFAQWVRENRTLVAQATIVTGALVSFALGLKLVSSAVLVVTRGVGLLVSLIGFLTSPIGLVVAALVTLWVAWDRNWGDIQGKTEEAVDFIRKQWDRLSQWWEESEIGQSIRSWWQRVLEVWNSEELTLPEKAVEIAKLTPGVGWIVGFVEDVRSIWGREDLTFGEKVVGITRLVPGLGWLAGFMDAVRGVWEREDLTFGEKLVEIARLLPGVRWTEQFVADVRAIWNREDLTLGEKIAEIARLIPGVRWFEQFITDVRAIWDREDLTLGEKVASIARLVPGVGWLVDFVADVRAIWGREDLTLPEKVAEIARLIPGVQAVQDMIAEIREVWAREDLSLPEKITETFKVIANRVDVEAGDLAFAFGAAITAPYLLDRIADAIRLVPGLLALTQPGNILRLGIIGMILALGVYGWRLWNASRESEESLTAEAERITTEALAAGIEVGLAVNAIRWTLVRAAALRAGLLEALAGTGAFALVVQGGMAFLNLIGTVTVGLSVLTAIAYAYMPDEERDALKARIQEIWDDEQLALSIKVARIALEILEGAWAPFLDDLDEKVFKPVREAIGTEPSEEGRFLQQYLTAPEEQRREMVRELQERLGETYLQQRPSWWQQFLWRIGIRRKELPTAPEAPAAPGDPASMVDRVVNAIIAGNPHLQRHRDILADMAERLVAIGEAKGAPLTLQELAEVMALLLSESSTVLGNMEAMQNPLRVTSAGFDELNRAGIQLIETTDGLNRNLEAGLELFRMYKREFGDPALAAGAYLFPSFARRGEWDRVFLLPGTDVTGLTPREKARRYAEILGTFLAIIPGMQTGGIVPQGPISGDWFPALLASNEAVIPADVWRRGLAAIAKWFRERGVPGFQTGRAPEVGFSVDVIRQEEQRLAEISVSIETQGRTLLSVFRNLFTALFQTIKRVIQERYPELAEWIEQLEADIEAALTSVDEQFQQTFEAITSGFRSVDTVAQQWTDNLVRGLSDAIAYGRSLHDVFDGFLRMLASRFIEARILGPLFQQWFPGLLGGLPVFHAGGLVLDGAGALLMHNGGIVPGLRNDERLIIAQTGERVLSRAQNAAFERMLRERDEPQEVNVNVLVQAVDAASFVKLAQRHPEAIKTVVLNDILSNGDIRKAIQMASRGR